LIIPPPPRDQIREPGRAEADAVLHHLRQRLLGLASLNVSIRGRTPASALKAMVSSESMELPLGHPPHVLPLSSENRTAPRLERRGHDEQLSARLRPST